MMLKATGQDVHLSDVAGYSLNAFAVWAHRQRPVSQWPEAGAENFAELMFRCQGVRGEILTVPSYDLDLLHHFISHWSARVQASLMARIPVAAKGAWPDALWGVVTEWEKTRRILKGKIPAQSAVTVNTCWPDRIILLTGSAVRPEPETALKWVLERAAALAGNRLERDGWVSGIDAYVVWRDRARGWFAEEKSDHLDLARYLACSREYAARFCTRHADLHQPGIERMMLGLARHYHRSSIHLARAAETEYKRDFICAVTQSLAEEEKALVLTEEILFHLD